MSRPLVRTVSPGTELRDTISPRSTRYVGERMEKIRLKREKVTQWRKKPMFAPHQDKPYHEHKEYIGEKVSLNIPLDLDGEIYDYMFTFKILKGRE